MSCLSVCSRCYIWLLVWGLGKYLEAFTLSGVGQGATVHETSKGSIQVRQNWISQFLGLSRDVSRILITGANAWGSLGAFSFLKFFISDLMNCFDQVFLFDWNYEKHKTFAMIDFANYVN